MSHKIITVECRSTLKTTYFLFLLACIQCATWLSHCLSFPGNLGSTRLSLPRHCPLHSAWRINNAQYYLFNKWMINLENGKWEFYLKYKFKNCHTHFLLTVLALANKTISANSVLILTAFFFFKQSLFIFRERGRERNMDRLPFAYPQLGFWPATQARALTRNWIRHLSFCWDNAQLTLSHTSQGFIF